jgi:hypothetical protein
MKTQKILDNFHALPVVSSPRHDVNDVLFSMYRELLKLSKYSEEGRKLAELVPEVTFELRRVYGMWVGNDHACMLYLLVADGQPLAFFGKHGYEDNDSAKGVAHVVDTESANHLAGLLSAAIMVQRLKQYRDSMDKAPVELLDMGGNEYLVAVSDTTFGSGQAHGVQEKDMHAPPFSTWVHTGKKLARVNKVTACDDDADHVAVGETEQGVVPLQYSRVLFQFMDSQEDREAAMQTMSGEGEWTISKSECNPKFRMVVAYIREPHSWHHRLSLITFGTERLYKAFLEANAHGIDTRVPGLFPFDTVPDDATFE